MKHSRDGFETGAHLLEQYVTSRAHLLEQSVTSRAKNIASSAVLSTIGAQKGA